MSLEPKGRTARANFSKIGALAAIAEERRMLVAHIADWLGWSPHQLIGRVRANILRVAVNASL